MFQDWRVVTRKRSGRGNPNIRNKFKDQGGQGDEDQKAPSTPSSILTNIHNETSSVHVYEVDVRKKNIYTLNSPKFSLFAKGNVYQGSA